MTNNPNDSTYLFSDFEIRKHLMDWREPWSLGIPSVSRDVSPEVIEQTKSKLYSTICDEVTQAIREQFLEKEFELEFTLLIVECETRLLGAEHPRLGGIDVHCSFYVFFKFNDQSEQLKLKIANPFDFDEDCFMAIDEELSQAYQRRAKFVHSLDFPTK